MVFKVLVFCSCILYSSIIASIRGLNGVDHDLTVVRKNLAKTLLIELFDQYPFLEQQITIEKKLWFLLVLTYIALESGAHVAHYYSFWKMYEPLQEHAFLLQDNAAVPREFLLQFVRPKIHEYEPRFFVLVRDYIFDGTIAKGLERSSLIKKLYFYRQKYGDGLEELFDDLPCDMVKSWQSRIGFQRIYSELCRLLKRNVDTIKK